MRNIITIILLGSILAACGKKETSYDTLEAVNARIDVLSQELQELEEKRIKLDPESQKVRSVAVKAQTLEPRTFKHYVNVQGQVESNRNVQVSPKMSGNLLSIKVKEGQSVRAGQLLATIDDAIIRRNKEELETQLGLATTLYEKQKRLWEKEIGTEIQYLQAKANKESMERRMATLDEQLSMSRIKAPISGIVDEVLPKTGEMVSPGFPAFRIVSATDLNLVAELSESYIPYVRRGDGVKAKFPTLNKEINARVSVVGQSVDPNSRTFKVEAKLPADRDIKANMFGEMAINDRIIKDAITVPLYLLQKSEKGNYVYIAEKKGDQWVAARRDVVLGVSYDGEAEIKSGLKGKDILITDGYKDLSDGQAIEMGDGQ